MTVDVIDPESVFQLLQRELPAEVLSQVFVAGSLAAAYHHRARLSELGVKTKDADLVLHPSTNTSAAKKIAEALLASGWKRRESPEHQPGTESTPVHLLPAIRLYPPNHTRYFIELLIVPAEGVRGRQWQSVDVGGQYYGLPMFEFMALLTRGRGNSSSLEYADPRMMALANALSHPELDNDAPMSTSVEDRQIHRSSKDLGRVLALAWLAGADDLDTWATEWMSALKATFPSRWHELAKRVGAGLRALCNDPERFNEAYHTCNVGLLSGQGVTEQQLLATAMQFLDLVVVPVEAAS